MLQSVVFAVTAALLFMNIAAVHRNVQVISIDLAKDSPAAGNNVYKYRDILTEGDAELRVKNAPNSIGFFVVQVHTFLYPIQLTTTRNNTGGINGTNVGLVQIINNSADAHIFFVASDPSVKISVLITVVLYDKKAPIPGGCNLTFKTEIAPYQIVKLLEDMIRVDAQAPSTPHKICEQAHIHVEFYHLYLKEHYLSEDNYFDGIDKMLTVESIRTYGRKVSGNPYSPFRNYYSAYRGTGSVFGIIATHGNDSSAYVPAVSYACDVLNWDVDCYGPITPHWKFLCAVLLFTGFFLCFFGHRFFRVSLFIAGFIFGAFITYLILSHASLSFEDSTIAACGFGIIFGAFWVCLWFKCGMPIFSALLMFLLNGMLISGIVFYSRFHDLELFRSNVSYGFIVTCMVIAYTIILLTLFSVGHIFACSLLGSYAMVAAFSHYFGGNLQYIIANMFRRATVENFNLAIADPPYQVADINLTVTWVFFFLTGICSQLWLQMGKPPFPPHSRPIGEYIPLLFDNSRTSYTFVSF